MSRYTKCSNSNFLLLTKYKLIYVKQGELHSVLRVQNTRRLEPLSEINVGICYSIKRPANIPANNLKVNTMTEVFTTADRGLLTVPDIGRSRNQKGQPTEDYEEEDDGCKLADDSVMLLVVTGHVDGKVVLWQDLKLSSVLATYQGEIIDICLIRAFVAVATSEGVIEIWTMAFDKCIRKIDLRALSFKLLSNHVKNLVVTPNSFYFNTYGGDFIKVKLQIGQEKIGELSMSVKQEVRCKNIVMFDEEWTAMCVIEKNDEKIILVTGKKNSIVYGLSNDTHELVDYYKLAGDEIIESMDAIIMEEINPIFIYGTSTQDGHHGRVLLRKNWSNSPQAIDVDKGVTELKFSPRNDFVICATKNFNFYVIKQQEGMLKPESKRVISMDKELPLTINFCDQDRIAIITTEQKRHFRVNIDNPEKFEEIEDKEVFNLSLASLRYHDTLNYSPVVIGQELEYIVSMRDDELEFWKNIPDLASNCGIRMNGHSSKVFGIQVSNSKEFVYSLGSTDNCLIEWHTTYELSNTSDKRQLNTLGTKGESFAKANQSAISPEEAEETHKVMRECLFCQNIGEKSYSHRDSFTLFRGNSVKILNALNYKEDQKEDRSFVQRRVPEISIKLNYVYGLEAFNRRKTMYFVHYYSIGGKTQKQKEGNHQQQGTKVEQLNLPENYMREMLFSKYTPIPYDQKHQNCRRYIVYFCSRIAVVWECNTGNPKQSFYEGHRSKISCMAIHPSKMVVATAEAENHGEIHVWSMVDCCLLKKRETSNLNGVAHLAFSFDGLYLISVGISGKLQDDLSDQNVEVSQVDNNGASYITAVACVYYLPGDQIVTDLIVGNSRGDIGLVTCGKFILLKKKAHNGMINIIKVTDALHEKLVIITSGEDEVVRFWDLSFKVLSEYHLKQLFPETSNSLQSRKNLSVQSLDIFACSPPPSMKIMDQMTTGYEKDNPVLLLGTRSGAVIEITLGTEFKTLQATPGEMGRDVEKPGDIYEKKETYQEMRKIVFHPRVLINNHASQTPLPTNPTPNDVCNNRRIKFAMHPEKPLMISTGSDNELVFWNINNHKSPHSMVLKDTPICIKFSPNGKFICLGYEKGTFEIISITFGSTTKERTRNQRDVGAILIAAQAESKGSKESQDMDMPSQKVVQTFVEQQTNLINVEFSSSSSLLAASFLDRKEQEDGAILPPGYVKVFKLNMKYIESKTSKEEPKEPLYALWRVIKSPEHKATNSNMLFGSYFMSFSSNEEYICLHFLSFDRNLNREPDDKEKTYLIWDLVNDMSQTNTDLVRAKATGKLNFPSHINGYYRFHERYLDPTRKQSKSQQEKKNLIVSAMEFFQHCLFLGSSKGDLNVCKASCLQMDNMLSVESLKSNQYNLAKSYTAHCSAIDTVLISPDLKKLFTCSQSDEVIFEWAINKGNPHWELDHSEYNLDEEDKFLREVETRDEYEKIINEMLTSRDEIVQLKASLDESVEPEISLKLEKIIGRKAFNRRNNVFYTENNHLIYSAASMLVMVNIPPEGMEITAERKKDFFKEKFLEVDSENQDSTSPKISTLTLSPCRKYVCVGTYQRKAMLITWELTTNTFIKSWTLDNCCVIQFIKYSSDKKRLVVIALTENYTQILMLIDNHTGEILGSCEFNYSIPFRIKDVDFLPKSNDQFVTIGMQHLSHWKLKGGLLVFEELPIENPKEMMEKAGILHITQERKRRNNAEPLIDPATGEEIFPLLVSFLSIIFLFDDLMITAGDDGFLYIWKNNIIIEKKNAHLNSTIFCLCNSKYHPNLFVSGGMDGSVNLWEMRNPSSGNLYVIEKIFEYPLTTNIPPEQIPMSPGCHIQSLQFRFNKIIAGTRSGDIYFLTLPGASENNSAATESKSLIMKVSTSHDHEIPKDIDLDSSRQRIFCITERGLFSSWSFNTMELLYQRAFGMQSTAMIVLKSRLYIIITFEKRVIVLDVKDHREAKEIPSFSMDLSLVSSDTRVSYDEKMLAVAMAPNDTTNTKISIFSINYEECKFEEYHTVEGISSSILFMDFSSDNVYLLYMDNIGKKHNIDLKDKGKDTKIELKEIEWISEGLKISDKRRGIDPFYTEENNVTCLVRAGRRSIIAADQIGTIRIFEYPCESTGYYRMYNHHLNFIRTLHVSKNGEYLISTSTIDKCIFVWKIFSDKGVAGDQDNERSEDYSKFD